MQPNNPFQNARWIGTGRFASPVISRTFYTGLVENATLFVTGLGYFEARLNGQPVTRERFLPPVSDYEPRRPSKFLYPLTDRPTNRIYYCEFDVTDLLREGENCLTIQLGNGFYRQTERVAEGPTGYGEILKTIYSLKLLTPQGPVSLDSDGSEVCGPSEITYSQLFIGETIDPTALREQSCPVELLPDPQAVLSPRLGPGDICAEVLHPISLGGGIYDAGKNISGLVRLRTHAPRGSRIVLRFAENLTPGGDLDFTSTGADYICASGRPQIMEDVFICDGEERWFEPKFVWHAFRYFSVQGEFDEAQVLVIHSDCPVTATFKSPSEGLNHIFEAFLRTQLNNMHGGIPSDCPHRERLGYTGDGQVCAEAAMLTMDCRESYRKWIRDILDCQDPNSGHVQHTAPLMGGGGGPGGWGCAIVLVPWAYWRLYGEKAMLEDCWDPMCKWVEYLKSRCENHLLVREEPGGWCLGDWCTLQEPVQLPPEFVNSCYFVKILGILEQIAGILGREFPFPGLKERIAEAVCDAFYDPMTGRFAGGIQGADAFALWAGLAKHELAAVLAEEYDALGHLDTGFLGTDILMEVLCEHVFIDTALKLLESEAPGSFLYQKRRGATTLWETWTGGGSQDHPMFGACVRQLFTALLGIRPTPEGDLEIKPQIPEKLPWVRGSVLLPQGRVGVAWQQVDGMIRFEIDLPPGVTARFSYGSQAVQISGHRTLTAPRIGGHGGGAGSDGAGEPGMPGEGL